MRAKGAIIPTGFNTLTDDEIATYHNTFASNTNNKRSSGMQIKRRIITIMALIQNDDNKCPTTKQVNDALQSMGGYC